MIRHVFSVRDDVAEVFQDPMFEINDMIAKRKFQIMMRNIPEGVYPGEFSLWECADFDDHTGQFTDYEPRMIMRGVSDGD